MRSLHPDVASVQRQQQQQQQRWHKEKKDSALWDLWVQSEGTLHQGETETCTLNARTRELLLRFVDALKGRVEKRSIPQPNQAHK